jgi:hypothetical protein
MEVSGQLHAPAALLQEKCRRYPLELGGPLSRYGHGDEDKNSQTPLPQGIEPQNPGRSLVAIPTEL